MPSPGLEPAHTGADLMQLLSQTNMTEAARLRGR